MTEQEIINELLIMAGNYEDSGHEPCIKDAVLFRQAAQKLAEAQKDSKRLDFMIDLTLGTEPFFKLLGVYRINGKKRGETPREAIDNAMEAQQ